MRGRALVALWLLAFSFYALTGTGHSSSWDSVLMLLSARNFLNHGSLSVPAYSGTELLRRTGANGYEYPKFAPGLIFAHLPMLVVGRIAEHLPLVALPSGEHPRPRYEDEFWVQLTNAWITAAILVVLFLYVIDLGGSSRDAWFVVLLVGLAGPLWLYAKADGTEALQAFALVGGCYFLHRARVRASPSLDHGIAGTFAGLGILAKTLNVVLVPVLLASLLWTTRSRRLAAATGFLLPVVAALALTGLYNHVRFGSPFESGYDLAAERFSAPLVPGILKLLFSLSYGLLWFWPASLVALVGFGGAWRAHRADTALAVGIFFTLLLVYSRWWAFSGFGWGPRFLIPAVPLLALLTLPVVSSPRRAAGILTLLCLLSGTAVQALASTTNHWQQILFGVYRYAECGTDGLECVDDPRVAPLRVAWWRVAGAFIRARHPERFAAYVETPPWEASRPWRWPETAVERQWVNTGLDFWAAPVPWRLEWYYLWAPGMEVRIPASPRLAWLLVVVFGGALSVVLRAVRERAGSA